LVLIFAAFYLKNAVNMANPIIMSVLKQIIRQWCNNEPIRAIVRHTGVSRNTVKTYINLIRDGGLNSKDLLEMEDHELEALFFQNPASDKRYAGFLEQIPYFLAELNRTGVNRYLLWEEYQQRCPVTYKYSQFCFHLQQYLKTEHATLHIEQIPGDKFYIDFTGKKLHWVDPDTGEVNEVEVFVGVLGYSHLTYALFGWGSTEYRTR
jgi:transposase